MRAVAGARRSGCRSSAAVEGRARPRVRPWPRGSGDTQTDSISTSSAVRMGHGRPLASAGEHSGGGIQLPCNVVRFILGSLMSYTYSLNRLLSKFALAGPVREQPHWVLGRKTACHVARPPLPAGRPRSRPPARGLYRNLLWKSTRKRGAARAPYQSRTYVGVRGHLLR